MKDVCIIPLIYHKYLGYTTSVICKECKGEEETFKNKGLPIIYIDDTNSFTEELKKTDLLFLIGYYDYNLWIMERYKELNPIGKIYLKLDMNPWWFDRIQLEDKNKKLIESCNLISVECKRLKSVIEKKWNIPIAYIPNGYYELSEDRIIEFSEKENIIITVGRIGTREKANEVLLYSFALIIDKVPEWKLKFIGPVEQEFKETYEELTRKFPKLKDRIVLTGPIYDRALLEQEYAKAKIFALTSLTEGFPNVFPEAAIKGCYVISTDLLPAYDITKDGSYGSIVPINDINSLSEEILRVCGQKEKLESICYATQLHCRIFFDFIKLCYKIESMLFDKL